MLTSIIYLIAFISSMGNPIVLPALPFIMDDLALTPMQMGMMISVYALPGAVLLPFYGMLSDRMGRKCLLLTSLVLCVLGSLLCAAAQNFSLLLAGRALQGLSITPLDAMCFTLASDLFEGRKRMAMAERCSAVQFFCVVIVPLVLSLLIPLCGWRSAFCLAAMLGGAALILSLPATIPYRPSGAMSMRRFLRHAASVLLSRRLCSLFAVRILAAVIIFGVVYPHLPLLMVQKLSFAPELVGPMFSLYALGMFAGSLVVQRMVRHMKEWQTALLGGGFLLCAVLFLAASSSLMLIGAGLLCVGMGTGLILTLNTAHVSMAATPETHGTTMSVYSTVFRLGQAIAPGIMGVIYAAGSFPALFCAAGAIAVATGIIASLSFAYAGKQEAYADSSTQLRS